MTYTDEQTAEAVRRYLTAFASSTDGIGHFSRADNAINGSGAFYSVSFIQQAVRGAIAIERQLINELTEPST